jgi:hypothetical protein
LPNVKGGKNEKPSSNAADKPKNETEVPPKKAKKNGLKLQAL